MNSKMVVGFACSYRSSLATAKNNDRGIESLFIAGIKKPLLTEARRSGLLRYTRHTSSCMCCDLNYLEYIRTYLFFARSKEATISALAASAFSQPSTFTHLPFSRSL
ncbi:hypothetical protein D9741_08170 [Escherichia sp. E14V7]|nr:hypothetical protein D9740_10220 [Escherichia sp. E14V5]RZN04869.1 hypothetical protein D9741_08170 [Escherichia sp. E14V7]RZN27488.1 hypothetical protein D9739_10125 [Escherichia sp. E14V10]TGB55455.1 hypothetical protein CRT22_16685 [Escherichia sp. E5028]